MERLSKIGKARSRMFIEHVFFAALVLSTEFVEKKGLGTAATDMKVIFYDPDFINSLDVKVVIFVIVHEAMHIALKHGLRRGHRDHMRWNIACDHAINLMLKDAGLEVWKDACQDPKYKGMTAEEIYDKLPKDEQPDSMGGGDLMEPACGDDPAEKDKLDRQISGKVAQAVIMAKAQGKMPAAVERAIDGIINPPQPWQVLFVNYMTRVVASADETWSRRNRRFRIMLPGRQSMAMGEVVVIGDTSGSMGDEVFAQVGGEINAMIEYVNPERVRVIWADDAPCSRQEIFEPGEEVVLHPKGGGGTDMTKALKFVEEFDPVVVVLVTDCETPWPKQETPYPLIVCATTKAKCPDWALRVDIRIGA